MTKLVSGEESGENFSSGFARRIFPKAKMQSPFMTQPVISPAPIFRLSRQNSTNPRIPEIPKKDLSELLGPVPETKAQVVCSDTNSSSSAGTFPEEIPPQKMSVISLRSTILRSLPDKSDSLVDCLV